MGYLFSCNDESERIIIHNGQRHYRKYFSRGRYMTLLGEIIIKRGIFQANQTKHSICPLENKLKFINDYVSFAAAEYICYNMASMTLSEFVKHCRKWSLMKPSEGTVKRVLDYVGNFLETTDFPDSVRSKEQMPVQRILWKKAVTPAMSIDSTCVNIRQDGWRHATAATKLYNLLDETSVWWLNHRINIISIDHPLNHHHIIRICDPFAYVRVCFYI